MQTDSSASRTCLRLASAVECTATVLMPSSRQARRMRSAISPRLAIRIFSSMGMDLQRGAARLQGEACLLDDEQRLIELDRLAVLDQNSLDPAGPLGLDLVHHLHGLDDAQDLSDLDFIAHLHEGLGAGGRRGVVSADHGRGDDVLASARTEHLAVLPRGGRGRRGGDIGGLLRRQHAGDAQRLLPLLDLDLSDARFLEQLDHFLDFAYVQIAAPAWPPLNVPNLQRFAHYLTQDCTILRRSGQGWSGYARPPRGFAPPSRHCWTVCLARWMAKARSCAAIWRRASGRDCWPRLTCSRWARMASASSRCSSPIFTATLFSWDSATTENGSTGSMPKRATAALP